MPRKIYTIFIALISAFLLFGFNNCSKDVEFKELASNATKTFGDTLVDDDIQSIIDTCDEAFKKGQLLDVTHNVKFEDTKIESGRSQVCEFKAGDSSDDMPDAAGNFTMKNTYLRARYEQYHSIQLPANAVVCSVAIDSDEQTFKYDDVIYLTMNNYIMATNQKSTLSRSEQKYFSSSNINLTKYAWQDVANTTFKNEADDYCAGQASGSSTCSWPVTEQTGQIDLAYDPEVLVPMSSVTNLQTFGFITTGDNDPNTDCHHKAVSLDLNLKYFIKN